jgi:NAD(P)H dehydrogenase (quinone)
MKNALLITAHPYTESFNFSLRSQTIELLSKFGWQVNLSDLYQQNFNPILGPSDFSSLSVSVPVSLPKQQEVAHRQALFNQEIMNEQSKLLAADLVILQFPLWWGSYPAILKGWIERVISNGYAYGSKFLLAEKKVLLSVTTGGASNEEEVEYYQRKLYELGADIFCYAKMKVLEPIISHGPARSNYKQRQVLLASSNQQLTSLLNNS